MDARGEERRHVDQHRAVPGGGLRDARAVRAGLLSGPQSAAVPGAQTRAAARLSAYLAAVEEPAPRASVAVGAAGARSDGAPQGRRGGVRLAADLGVRGAGGRAARSEEHTSE